LTDIPSRSSRRLLKGKGSEPVFAGREPLSGDAALEFRDWQEGFTLRRAAQTEHLDLVLAHDNELMMLAFFQSPGRELSRANARRTATNAANTEICPGRLNLT
jgi:hypothetical protein